MRAELATQLAFEDVHDCREGPATAMPLKIVHILKQKSRRSLMVDDLG